MEQFQTGQSITLKICSTQFNIPCLSRPTKLKLGKLELWKYLWWDPQMYLTAATFGKSVSSNDITDLCLAMLSNRSLWEEWGATGCTKVGTKITHVRKWNPSTMVCCQFGYIVLAKRGWKTKHPQYSWLSIIHNQEVCQLVQCYILVSVLNYDKEYRKFQSAHEFRCGTDVPHLQSVHLDTCKT